MAQRIVIDPVTRIEGHAKITIYLDDADQVTDARFHVTEFRGFEKFCEGRPFTEMPGITTRVCGICPVSHLMASSKAGDAILAVSIPPTAEKLRRIMNVGQIVQSHALSVFHLSGPDLLLGMDSDPLKRNVFGLMADFPEVARAGIRLRQFGQEIIGILGARKIHPAWSVPGGVTEPLSPEGREQILARIPEAKATTRLALGLVKGVLDNFREEVASFGNFPSLFLGLVGDDGSWEHYGGHIRITDSTGTIVADRLDGANYQQFLGESVEHDSYLKSPYYLPMGYPDGIYRVGPLARLNICEKIGTPLADAELEEYRQRGGRTVNASFWYHYARLVEIMAGIEQIEHLLNSPDILSKEVHAHAGVNRREGVGISEAPRGTLFHHYRVNDQGLLTFVNMIIATGQNNLAMNRAMAQIAKHFIKGLPIAEVVLNRLEAGIRAFDPCLSCSTHAIGAMPLHVQVLGPEGSIREEVWRN